jgi:putative hydroxymethylpyrimidine transport system substrate-binding protein
MFRKLLKVVLCLGAFFMSQTVLAADNHITVFLDWFVNPNHAPLFIAEQQGFFKQQGLTVEMIPPASPDDGPKLVAAGKADVAITYQTALLVQVTHGLPVVRFATLVNQPLDCLLSINIHDLSQLKGKTLGYSSAGTDALMLKAMLAHQGLTPQDVQLINVKFDLTQALLAGKIDGFTGAMRNFEPFQVALAGKKPVTFYPEQYGFPNYDELIFITHKNHAHDVKLVKFTVALEQGVKYLLKHPDSSWQAFVKKHPELNNELNKKAWFASIPYFALHPGHLDTAKYEKFAQYMAKEQNLSTLPPVANYAVDTKTP